MINVIVKTPANTPSTATVVTAMSEALDVVGKYALEKISYYASTKLHSAHLTYQHGLQDTRSYIKMPGIVAITLVGQLPNMLEGGFSPFDIKAGLMKSKKVKRGKSGSTYIDIPFRWGTPGTTTMQSMSKATYFGVMNAYKVAKNTGIASARQKVQSTLRSPGAMHAVKGIIKGGQSKMSTQLQNRVGLQDQMTRTEHTYKGTTQAKFSTFRRVSSNSRQSAWIHPGYPGLKAFDFAAAAIKADIPRIVKDYLKRAGVSV